MIVTLAVLTFIGFVFGMTALRVVILGGLVYMALVLHMEVQRVAPHPDAMSAQLRTCSWQEMHAANLPGSAWGDGWHPADCAPPAGYQMPAAVPPAAAPAPAAAEASPSPARAWELLPWPPGSAEITDHPSAAAQGLLDRLNAAQGLK